MQFSRIRVALLAAFMFVTGCSGAYGPDGGSPDEFTRTATDPVGDVFGTATRPWDVTMLQITRAADAITIRLDLTEPVLSPASGDPDALIAFVDLDVDRNASTGKIATVDEYRPPGAPTAMGVDYELALTEFAPDGSVAIVDAQGREAGRVTPTFSDRHVTVRIPLSMLGDDDGFLDAAAIVGSTTRPSDIVPEHGSLHVVR